MATGTPRKDDGASQIFKDVKYYLIGNIHEKIVELLDQGGARRDAYLSEMVTHAIGDDPNADDFNEAKDLFEIPVVTSRWVELSVKCGCLLPPPAFSPESGQIFSGVVACPSQLSSEDSKKIWAIITFYGGQCQLPLNKKCTHLITSRTTGPKYECALRHQDKIKVVSPDWVLDCLSSKRKCEEVKYHPKLLLPDTLTKSPVPSDKCAQSQETPTGPQRSASPSMQVTPVQFLPLSTPKTEGSKTKEALARMVNSRIQANKKVFETPELLPVARPPLILGELTSTTPPLQSPQTSRANSPRTLKNITNSSEPRSPASRAPRSKSPAGPRSPRSRQPKVNQLVGQMPFSPRGMSPGHMLQGAMARPPMQIPGQEIPMYFGHDPVENVPADLCLMGCVFYITDYQKYLDTAQMETWKKVIEQHGGAVDASYSNRITHLLCEHQKSDKFQMAVKDRKRVVTAHWLNDVLVKKHMMPPWMAIHYPSLYGDSRPCQNQIICVTNFQGADRTRIKHMISLIGARYTGYMTHANSVCICKIPQGIKYDKALEWRIPVVNITWLNDVLLGNLEAVKLPVNARYKQFTSEDPFIIDPYRMAHLMEGWKTPLRIPKDAWKRYNPIIPLQRIQPLKRKSDENLLQAAKRPRLNIETGGPHPDGRPCVLITGIPRGRAEDLSKEVERLGGHIASCGKECTHLVARGIARTVKFLTAISKCRYIVSPDWLLQCSRENRFSDETPFLLRDDKMEREFKFSLLESMRRAKLRPVFKGFMFYITPSTEPRVTVLQEILENAGGELVKRRPNVKTISSHRDNQGNPLSIIITCENDLHICQDLKRHNIHVYNAEFILTGVLRQQVEYSPYMIEY